MSQPENHPLLNPLIAACVFEQLAGDSRFVYQGIRVCRLWWSEGHKQLWRHARLGDLYTHIHEVERRAYFSRYIETVTLQPCDAILASQQMILQPVVLERLKSLNINQTNLINVIAANMHSLIPPSLRSLTIRADWIPGLRDTESDSITFLNALMNSCDTLTTLDLDLSSSDTADTLLLALLARLTVIENLTLGEVTQFLYERAHDHDFLRRVLNKTRLVTLAFPHGVDFADHAVQTFLTGMNAHWSLPSLQSLSCPVFFSSQAAASLLNRLPNLEDLELELEDFQGDWDDALEHTFDALSRLKQLKMLDLRIAVNQWNLRGSWLVKLAGLKKLERLWFWIDKQPTVILSGTQLAAFLAGLPRLNSFKLNLGTREVMCSVDEKCAIETALARINKLDIDDFNLNTRHSV